ncbi:hypothetical protein [Compostimonas suwonensis]|uniref:PH domain-containing protein n=1 Tax=Compostimonas suwonensis TaxID=1048394 RepID=A0A2M9BYI1_9MICO|nr:hypothetical protein [Compostimonas suwonensis]PJJ63135.1 hypothetical protein CLV54_0791 [Compostimonas suwonensis]
MDRVVPGIVVVIVLLVVLFAMWWGWRRRRRARPGIAPLGVPAELGVEREGATVLYVATTQLLEPLERVAVTGLAYRAKARLAVHDAGVVIAIPGQADVFVPVSAVVEVGTATWAIDRVVEPGGLLFLSWTLGPETVDSYFRVQTPADKPRLIAAVEGIAPHATQSAARGESTEVNK